MLNRPFMMQAWVIKVISSIAAVCLNIINGDRAGESSEVWTDSFTVETETVTV